MSSIVRALLGLAAATAVCTSAAGCGGSSDPLAGLTARQVLSKAVGDLKAQPSFRMAGLVNESGGIDLSMAYKHGSGCTGTLSVDGKGGLTLVVIGNTAWFKPDTKFWQSSAGSSASEVIAQIGGKYLKSSANSSQVSSLTELCNVNSMAASFVTPKDIVKGKMTTIDGQQALSLRDPAKNATMYVSDSSSPQILRVVGAGSGNSGHIDFTDLGESVTLTAPPASQTVDGARYGF